MPSVRTIIELEATSRKNENHVVTTFTVDDTPIYEVDMEMGSVSGGMSEHNELAIMKFAERLAAVLAEEEA